MKSLDVYLIAARKSHLLFSPPDRVEALETASDHRIQRWIGWLIDRPNRLVAWIGRTLRGVFRYYLKLEDRIDPQERVLKAIAGVEVIVIYHGPGMDALKAEQCFSSILRRQRWKHIFWFLVDGIVASVVAVFTPFLAPIPGPNVLFYYPFLRVWGHYRATRGCAAGLDSRRSRFICLPELSGLEENLRTPVIDRHAVRATAEALNVRGLHRFLERMV